MKIAILGGSFNPLHIGHAMAADTVIKELGYDKVLFVPTCIPPHKTLSGLSSPEQRLLMVKVFCDSEGEGHFELETCEIDRGGVSYTIDTVKYLSEKYKGKLDGKIGLIMGEEIAAEFEKWYCPDQIADLCELIVFPRYSDYSSKDNSAHNKPTGTYEGDFKVRFNKENFKYPCTVLEKPVLPVSSTEIRSRISEKRSFKYLVPGAVYEFIQENQLYR